MITVNDKQSILDLALQYAGGFEEAYNIAEANDVSLTDDLTVGQQLSIPSVMNQDITTYYKVRSHIPATHITSAEIAERTIGYSELKTIALWHKQR